MRQVKNFTFYTVEPDLSGFCAVLIPHTVTTVTDVILLYDSVLNFPYGENNWNSLYDCLTDLSWVTKDVAIMHDSIPELPPVDLIVYLKLLSDVVVSWNTDYPTRVKVLFPEINFNDLDRILH